LVFHKTYNGGFGPAVSLYLNEHEFLKFDCFGIEKGHYHIYDGKTNDTIFFAEKTCREQIDKTAYELSNNIEFYLKKSNNVNIQNFKINIEVLLSKMNEMKNKMLEYENTFYSDSR
jgi:hypothetical protein